MAGGRVMLGIVLGPQGVRGRVRVKSFTENPEAIAQYGPLSDERGTRQIRLRSVGQSRGAVLAEIDGVADRNAAEAMRGLRLYADRAALPPTGPREFYHADLVGLRVVDRDGAALGTVKGIHDFGAGPLVEISPQAGGATLLLPFSDTVVPLIDLETGMMKVEPPLGWLDGETAEAQAAMGEGATA